MVLCKVWSKAYFTGHTEHLVTSIIQFLELCNAGTSCHLLTCLYLFFIYCQPSRKLFFFFNWRVAVSSGTFLSRCFLAVSLCCAFLFLFVCLTCAWSSGSFMKKMLVKSECQHLVDKISYCAVGLSMGHFLALSFSQYSVL